jgi:YD repeat-containing protein
VSLYVSYTDIISPTPKEGQFVGTFEINRTYNCKSDTIGDFGYGWGYDFETRIHEDHEGGLIVFENGSGATTRFIEEQRPRALEAALSILAMKETSPYGPNASNLTTFTQSLMQSKETREIQFIGARYRREILKQSLPQDWTMRINRFCSDPNCSRNHGFIMERTTTGYRRKPFSGGFEEFDSSMRIVLKQDANGYFVRIIRDAEGRIRRFQDANGYQVDCETNEEGRITGLRDSIGRTVEYRYEGSRLAMSQDVAGNIYEFEYDDNVNMTQISYLDKSKLRVEYDKNSFVTKVIERTGEMTTYDYGKNPDNPDLHYWTTVKKYNTEGVLIDDNRYEFEYGVSGSGIRYTRRIVTERRLIGQREESVFSPQGDVISEDVNGMMTRYEYDQRSKAVSAVIKQDSEVRWVFYPHRRLATRKIIRDVANNHERVFDFEYTKEFDRLLAIRDSDGLATTFEHDQAGRVVKIRRGADTIEWTRNADGKIESGSLNGGVAWTVEATNLDGSEGFVIDGELAEKEREGLVDWLGLLKTATSMTFCPESLPVP